ncbi:MAG TPA: amidohydrolase family protein [Gemmatimonadaceae bacterium]|nr:amidohydrolase family protein [Gemmatimonadaceae bacterium]
MKYTVIALLAAATAAQAQTIAITGGTVYPVSGPKIEHGTVIIRDGKIAAVGANVSVPTGAQTIDATGKWVTPGLINSATQLGVEEVQAVSSTSDERASGENGVAASFRVIDGFNPLSTLIQPARNDGITSVVDIPQSGGVIFGQAGFVDLASSDMIVRSSAAMVGQFGNTSAGFGRRGGGPEGYTRGEMAARLRELFDDVKTYAANKAAYDRAQSRPLSASRADLEALIPVVEGRLPLIMFVDRASDINEAMAITKAYGVKLIVGGGAEAWEVAPALAAAKIPVLTGALDNIPNSFEQLGQRHDNIALLRKAGVNVALIGNGGEEDGSPFNVRNIRQEAGTAVAFGLSWDEALKAITLAPAEIFGVADRLGTLQTGRDANVVVWSGDPFEFSTQAVAVFVRGQQVKAPSRQDLLMERYKTLPRPTYRGP